VKTKATVVMMEAKDKSESIDGSKKKTNRKRWKYAL